MTRSGGVQVCFIVVILWLNGPFGVGKTSVARRLVARLPAATLLDPERIGFVLARATREGRRASDFQDLTAWRTWTVRGLRAAAKLRAHVVVPMTLVDVGYFEEIVGALRGTGIDVRHFTLMAAPGIVRARLHARGSAVAWGERQLDRCITALNDPRFAEHVATDAQSIDDVAEEIARRVEIVRPSHP